MAVARNDSGTNNVNSQVGVSALDLTTFTVSAGSNLCLIAFMYLQFNDTFPPGITVNWDNAGTPQAMTSAGVINGGGISDRIEVFYLVNPTTGNKTLHAAWGNTQAGALGAVAFSGVNQSTPIVGADTASATATSATPSVAITSSSDGATVVGVSNINQTLASTDTQTELYRVNTAAIIYSASYGLGGSSNTHTWTLSASAQWVAIGVHLQAVVAAATQGIIGSSFNRIISG